MKKRFTALLLSVAAAVSCTAFSACDETEKKKSDGTTAEGSWYEEKSGYKFCGYYKDEDFTKPVTVKVTEETADKYHAKYQPDKVQLYECKPVDLEHTIYAASFQDAWATYMDEIGGVYDRSAMTRLIDYGQYGIPFTTFQIVTGDAEGSFTMRDTSETIPYDYKHYLIPSYMSEYTSYPEKKMLKRNNTWKACVYNPTHEQDGWQAFIVKNSFAVVVGMERDAEVTAETLEIPSKIGKYPVKEVSILGGYTVPAVKTLKIPSSVENVAILNTYAGEYKVENLEIAEGVETVRLDAYFVQNVSLPASAHYVDFRLYATNGPSGVFYEEQKVTVADGGHYYTKDGYLYSKEGDLCYQFANRDELNLRIDETAKRVLPHSVNGAAKNIYIPAGLEYFDLCFTRGGLRDWSKTSSAAAMELQPLLFISGDKVARRLLEETVQDYSYSGIPPMLVANSLPLDEYKEKVFEILATLDFEEAQLEQVKANCAFKECTAGYSCFIVRDDEGKDDFEYCSVVDIAFAAGKIMGQTPASELIGYIGRAIPNLVTGAEEWKLYTYIGEGEPTQSFDPILQNFKQRENAE